jgi:hypothetical protein
MSFVEAKSQFVTGTPMSYDAEQASGCVLA